MSCALFDYNVTFFFGCEKEEEARISNNPVVTGYTKRTEAVKREKEESIIDVKVMIYMFRILQSL